MAFIVPQSELNKVKRAIAAQFPSEQWEEVYSLLLPFMEHDTRLAMRILHLANGSKDGIVQYAEAARLDYRDVLFLAENPREAALDTPEKIEDLQKMERWLGLPADTVLEQERLRLLLERKKQLQDGPRRPWWRWWRTAEEMAVDFTQGRVPQSEQAFLAACGLPSTPEAARIALAVRRSVASYGMVAAEYIAADDRYPDELINLSGWDSLDLLTWSFELERELGEAKVPSQIFQRLKPPFSVKDLVLAVYDWQSRPEAPPRF